MPLYENRDNAGNKINISEGYLSKIAIGNEAVFRCLLDEVSSKTQQLGRGAVIAFDGWYGIDWAAIIKGLSVADGDSIIMQTINISKTFKSREQIAEYKQAFITDDPGFGFVNTKGHIIDLMDAKKIDSLKAQLKDGKQATTIVYGCGAAVPELGDAIDMTVYFDKTRQPILWQMWDGKLVPFGSEEADSEYYWKEYHYCDYYLLDRQKEYLYDKMDFWVEAISPDSLKMMPVDTYNEVIRTVLRYPVKEIKIFQPGPWGAYRYKDLFDVPGLECNAWNELAGPELGMMVDLGNGIVFEMPMVNLMQYQKEFLGEYLTEKYPRLFPLDIWLDDGFFPEKTPVERTAMPVHNHPSTEYVKRHFNEPLGRYETYYICEAYEGACTLMGYKDHADLEEWESRCRDSENLKEIADWREYVDIWDSNVGDLYLIPPGTAHGHGGNQMVLEMDTCPSISGTEYSFFTYDFARPSWDDNKKTMTGKPLKMHLEHSFDNERWRRSGWVKDNLLARPKVVKWTKDYRFDRYDSVPEMPFEIERFHFSTKADNGTQGKFLHILTLTTGKNVVIRSRNSPEFCTDIDQFQSALIPACFGEYEIISADGGFCEVVQLRWKKG